MCFFFLYRYRHFPVVTLSGQMVKTARPYLCNFLGTMHKNSFWWKNRYFCSWEVFSWSSNTHTCNKKYLGPKLSLSMWTWPVHFKFRVCPQQWDTSYWMLPCEVTFILPSSWQPQCSTNRRQSLSAGAADVVWWSKESPAETVNTEEAPLFFHVTVGGSSTKYFISVFELKMSYYSRMGRVMVAYDEKKNNWNCPCARPCQSCIHKATAKWHLLQLIPELFKRVKSSEELFKHCSYTVCNDDPSCQDVSYPPQLSYC